MKKIFCFIFLISSFASNAQIQSTDPAILMLKKFYTAYMSEFSATYDLETIERNLSNLRQKNCTPQCLKQYEKLGNETDADPLIKAQDSGTAFLKHLTVNKNPTKSNLYTVTYLDEYGKQKTTINLVVVKKNGVSKIAGFR